MTSAVELNGERLDAVVLAYLAQDAAAPEEELRRLLLDGAFGGAAARLAELCPELAANQWLQFQLKRHQFLQLAAAAASTEGREAQARQLQEALDLAKRELAPLALHAYCEAYSDFKHSMLALVSGGGGSCGAGPGPSPELREFAGMVARAARQEAACGDAAPRPAAPQLLQLLRYLLLLHQHQHHSGFHPYWWPDTSPQAQQLATRLLLPSHDALPPPALGASGGIGASGVREHDVQALRTSLGCDREEAVMLLRRARGSVSGALQDALSAAHVDEALLRELAGEYAASRGLEPAAATASGSKEGEPTDSPSLARLTKAGGKAGGKGMERDEAGAPLELAAELSEQQLHAVVCRIEHLLAAGQAEAALQQLEEADAALLRDHPAAAFALRRCCFLQQLAPAAGGGANMAAALAVVRQHLSPLAQQHPELQPQLKAALAMMLPLPSAAGGGDAGDAAAKAQQQGVADALAALRAALRPRCCGHEPRLLGLLRELLSLHVAHFKLQRCSDRFATELGIPALKAAPAATAPSGGGAAAAAAAEAQQALEAAAALGHAEVPVPGVRVVGSESDEDDSMEDDSGDEEGEGGDGLGVPEQAILTVCEFTGLPRHTAIELLQVHGGDAAAVLAAVFP